MKCSVCGSLVERPAFVRSDRPLSFDLEFRMCSPSVLSLWVVRCPTCGFCCRELSRTYDGSNEIVRDPQYQDQLRDPGFPELANSFLCFSRLHEAAGDLGGAALEALHAAWACDDMGWDRAAAECRHMCLSYLDAGGRIFNDGRQLLLRVELLRRAGDFSAAGSLCAEEVGDPVYRKVLCLQKKLISKRDLDRHMLKDAVEIRP